MVQEIRMPMMGNTMEIGTVVEWTVPEGAEVSEGETVLVVESEKASMDVQAERDGVLARIDVDEGTDVPPGTLLGVLLGPDEDLSSAPDPDEAIERPDESDDATGESDEQSGQKTVTSKRGADESDGEGAEEVAAESADTDTSTFETTDAESALTGAKSVERDSAVAPDESARSRHTFASPQTRRLARSLGVPIESVAGSGEGGKVTASDVRAAARGTTPPARTESLDESEPRQEKRNADALGVSIRDEQPLDSMRRSIAKRMAESARDIPQVTLSRRVPAEAATRVAAELSSDVDAHDSGAAGVHVGFVDVLVAAVAQTLCEHPRFNAWFESGELRLIEDVNIGVAVDLEDGLVAPVLRNVDQQSIRGLARERQNMQRSVLDGEFTMDDLESGTFTITNLGMFGVESFDPLVNPPQVAILGVSEIDDGFCPLDLTFDHRVVDGADAARFLDTLASWLETPVKLAVDRGAPVKSTDEAVPRPPTRATVEPTHATGDTDAAIVEQHLSRTITDTATSIAEYHGWPISDPEIDVTLDTPPKLTVEFDGDALPAMVRRMVYAACRETEYADTIVGLRDPDLTLVKR